MASVGLQTQGCVTKNARSAARSRKSGMVTSVELGKVLRGPVTGGPARVYLRMVGRGTIAMNSGIDTYYVTPDKLDVPPMVLRDPSLRGFHANGVDPPYWYYDP